MAGGVQAGGRLPQSLAAFRQHRRAVQEKGRRAARPLARVAQDGSLARHGIAVRPQELVRKPVANMMCTLTYKPGYAEVLERLRRLYERRGAIASSPRWRSQPALPIRRQYPQPQCDYPDPGRAGRILGQAAAERAAVEDDSLPSAYLSEFDQGLYGGLLGGEVRFLTILTPAGFPRWCRRC